jgi:hypothetical protein
MVANPAGPVASVHTLKVTLRDVRPAPWRRLEVPSAITLGELHDVLQDAFDWHGDHLHDFRVRGNRYTPWTPELFEPPFFGDAPRDEDLTPLTRVAPRPGDVLDYTYDFGDDWRHRIEVESVGPAAADLQYPVCTAGSGLAPEEDTGRTRPGRFDDRARQGLNSRLRHAGAVAGRDLPADDAAVDPVFTGIFPDLGEDGPGECGCGCGSSGTREGGMLPALHRAPDVELAAAAAESPLVRRAVALATWLGAGRSLTSSRVLRPADAVRAVDDLDLAAPLPPRSDATLDPAHDDELDVAGEDLAAGADDVRPAQEALDLFPETGVAATARRAGPRKIRSAKDLPYLHPLWAGCVAAGLIDVRGGKAFPGQALAVWQGPATPEARVESWAALLAGYLRARDDAARADRGFFAGARGQVLQATIPLLYGLAREPIPAGALALALADLDDTAGPMSLLMLPLVVSEMTTAAEDWLIAGVLDAPPEASGALATVLAEQVGEFRSGMDHQLAAMAAGPAGHESAAELRIALAAAVDALLGGPALHLTPLGAYGLSRLLVAHGWDVPASGDCADLDPADLLDRLSAYLPQDAVDEATAWLDARGDRWDDALRQVIWSAAVKGQDGPPRRVVLLGVLYAAGPRVAPVLDAFHGNPWLSAVVAAARSLLELGPEPTLAQRLWLTVDGVCLGLDEADDPDAVEEALEDSDLGELLAERGGIVAAAGLTHPRAREVLQAAVSHLDDPQLARSLRKALSGGSGHPALRSLGGRGGRGGRDPRSRGRGTRH